MRRVLTVGLSLVVVLTMWCASAFAARQNEDIVLQLDGGKFKVYRDVKTTPSKVASAYQKEANPVKELSGKARSLSQEAKSVSRKAAQPVKKAKSVQRSVSSRAKSMSRKAAEPVRRVSRAAQSQSRRLSSASRNAERLYSDVMKSKSLMEQTTPEPVPISQETWPEVETIQYVPETQPAAEQSKSKKSMKYIPVILAVAVAAAGAVLLLRKKMQDRNEEGEYKSFQ